MTAWPAGAVDLTGTWAMCYDCRPTHGCDPVGFPTVVDQWTVTQTGTTLAVTPLSIAIGGNMIGTITSATGAFTLRNSAISFGGVGTLSTINGTYDAQLQTGVIAGARRCNPLAPACDDGSSCTDDACVTTVVGTCSDMTPVAVCTNSLNGSCPATTTTTSASSTTTTTRPPTHYPVTGARLLLKRSASGRQTLVFVSRDPTIYVPPLGGTDDPTATTTQIDLFSPVAASPFAAISMPPVSGTPGWTATIPGPIYQFRNRSAPAGISVVRVVRLQPGKGIKIVARATGLPMTVPLGAAGIIIRLTPYSGSFPAICAHFGAASVRKDVPPVFVAGPSSAPPNCYNASLSAP